MEPLRSIASASVPETQAPSAGDRKANGFGEMVVAALQQANQDQLHAEEQARELAAGRTDIVDAMMALSRADLSLRFVVTLRNRALEAYQEIMRLQV